MATKSWWQLGEGMGSFGNNLSLYQIECAFCEEKDNWDLTHREQKKKPNGTKIIFFDTYKCGNCGGFVMVLWSSSEPPNKLHPTRGLHDFKVLPWPLRIGDGSDNWPKVAARYWKQAHKNLISGNNDAVAIMARSALQAITRQQKAKGSNLYEEIEDLSKKGLIPKIIKEWSHEVRLLGNPVAHPEMDEVAEDEPTDPKDAEDIVEFLDYLLEYLYDLPAQIDSYRNRKKGK